MFELPADLPIERPVSAIIERDCIKFNADHFGLPEIALKAIRKTENGNACTFSRNSDGSVDLGPMQINTIHFGDIQRLYPNINVVDIACKPCLNITISAWILDTRLKEVKDDIWLAVGNYHSKTPRHRLNYLTRIEENVNSILKDEGSK